MTGVFLTFFYNASTNLTTYQGTYGPLQGVQVSQAYASGLDLSFDVRAGLVMRQMHHWAALVFVAAIVVHLARVFFTGAFRRPREINWIIGLTLMLLAIVNGFAGYSLLDDQLSGTGIRIAYSVMIAVPFVGPWLASLLFGGGFPGPDIIPRLFIIHVLIVPVAIVVLLTAHLGDSGAPQAHPFPGSRRARRQRGGRAALADVRVQSGRSLLLRGRRARRTRGLRPDQSDLDLRPLPARERQLGVAARLVHGLARRSAAAHA